MGETMSARIKLEGQRFGRWVVGDYLGANYLKQSCYQCKCDCGTERPVVAQTLREGLTLSCGCMKGQAIAATSTRHGQSWVRATGQAAGRTYGIWAAMHNRCRGGTKSGRAYYQSKGVTVCERWNSFENFLADMGEAPAGKSIDRYPDKNGNYEPDNCRWATAQQQASNKRAYAPQGPRGVRVHNGTESRVVKPEQAAKLVAQGWRYGIGPRKPRGPNKPKAA
jgi:hypothetical protein